MNNKEFLDGFLKFLQSKYGSSGTKPSGTMYGNAPRMPLFEERDEQFPGGNTEVQQQSPMAPDQLGQQMNQLFPQQKLRDPMRMN